MISEESCGSNDENSGLITVIKYTFKSIQIENI